MRRLALAVLALSAICLLAVPIASGQGDPTGKEKSSNVEQQPKIPHEEVAFENEQVRVLKIHSEPHYLSPMHDHSVPRVVVFLTDFDARITMADGTARKAQRKAGDVMWRPAEKHAVENLSDKPFDQLEIEIKCPVANPKSARSGGN
jgi:hypothetical protein